MAHNSTFTPWYEVDPSRFQMEQMAMASLYPDFQLVRLPSGFLGWTGVLKSNHYTNRNGYQVTIDYDDCGPDLPGKFGMVVTPTDPDFNALFPPHLECLKSRLLDDIAAQMSSITYADPDDGSGTITTAASLLRQTADWFVKYEIEKARIEQQMNKPMDAAARYRQKVRERLEKSRANQSTPPPAPPAPQTFWWDNQDLYKLHETALRCTFPQFSMTISAYTHDGRNQKCLLIKGSLRPGVAFLYDSTRGNYSWSYNITLEYTGNEGHVYLDPAQSKQIYVQLGYRPMPLADNGSLIIENTTVITSVIHKALDWIIDLENLVTDHMSRADFEAKWNGGRRFEIINKQ